MGRFLSGKSGNPRGRRPGTSTVGKLRALLEPHAKDLVEKAVDLALEGDPAALRLCLERIIPPLKAQAPMINLPALKGSEGLSQMGQSILEAVGTGKISPDVASPLITALAAQGHLVEVDDLQARIEALEAQAERKAGEQ